MSTKSHFFIFPPLRIHGFNILVIDRMTEYAILVSAIVISILLL